MKTFLKACLAVVLLVLLIGLPIFFSCTPSGVTMWNGWFHRVQEADDRTNYETLRKVEDTCRAMIASYHADKMTYMQYKDESNEEMRGWAAQAKMRANKTASTYNNYILKNKYVWKNGVPSDIFMMLEYVD